MIIPTQEFIDIQKVEAASYLGVRTNEISCQYRYRYLDGSDFLNFKEQQRIGFCLNLSAQDGKTPLVEAGFKRYHDLITLDTPGFFFDELKSVGSESNAEYDPRFGLALDLSNLDKRIGFFTDQGIYSDQILKCKLFVGLQLKPNTTYYVVCSEASYAATNSFLHKLPGALSPFDRGFDSPYPMAATERGFAFWDFTTSNDALYFSSNLVFFGQWDMEASFKIFEKDGIAPLKSEPILVNYLEYSTL